MLVLVARGKIQHRECCMFLNVCFLAITNDDKGTEKCWFWSPEEKSNMEETVVPDKPEVVIFARFGSTAKYPVKVSMLGEMVRTLYLLAEQNGFPPWIGNLI
jgi:hypothetical protein